METLAYIHLALAYEEAVNIEQVSALNSQKFFQGLECKKLSSTATMYMLSLAVSLSYLGMASVALATLQPGDSGSEVVTLQQRLQQLGYFRANATGNFGPLTTEAVIQFQKAKGLAPDGIVGPQTEAALSIQRRSNQTQASNRPQVSNRLLVNRPQVNRQRATRPQVSNPPQVSNRRRGALQEGDKGAEVAALQQQLQKRGYLKANATGYYGPLTKAAVTQFQKVAGMPVDGVAGTDTQAALLGVGNGEFRTPAKPAVVSTGPFVQFGQTSQQVAAVQRQLRQMEYYQGRLTGYFDQETKDAVTKFQQEQRLTADGVVGPNTLAALEKASAKASDRSSMLSLQKRLKENGFYNGPLNGVFDKQTKAAVEAAQRDYGLSADDIVKGRF